MVLEIIGKDNCGDIILDIKLPTNIEYELKDDLLNNKSKKNNN